MIKQAAQDHKHRAPPTPLAYGGWRLDRRGHAIASDRAGVLISQTPSQTIASPSPMPHGGNNAWKPSRPPITMATEIARGNTPARRLAMPNRAQPAAKSR